LSLNALVVCHAGLGIGLGHLTRLVVVARALQKNMGFMVKVLIQGCSIPRAELDEFKHQFIEPTANLSAAIQTCAQEIDARVVILDLHAQSVPADIDKLLMKLRQSGLKVIAVDHLVSKHGQLDLAYIPSFYRSFSYGVGNETPVVYGWDCFLLNTKKMPIEWNHGRKVLVLTGGSDTTGLGRTLPKQLNEALPSTTELHWITGPYAQQPLWPTSFRISILNHQSPSSLDSLMVESNYAMTVYGVSFFELLYYGVPTVVFSPYGNKDDTELAVIAAEGLALVARNELEAVDMLKNLMANDALSASLSQRARDRMSAQGHHKFTQAISILLD
jgi:spore coat polysaccharide biosynthesis predicted glycosyltransferase SpsG